jgi:(E)-4-hydroxy-3-methyl-but-2-enyl pyrophosphate reductase
MTLEATARFGGSCKINSVGEIIHNPQALEYLKLRGLDRLESGFDAQGGALVIRAHGIPFEEYRYLAGLRTKGQVHLYNGTCPEVAKVQACIRRYHSKGYWVIILGDARHPEVVAHQSYAGVHCSIVATLEEARALPDEALERGIVVAQTTFTREDFRTITDALRSRRTDLIIRNTICRETWARQADALTLAQSVEAVVVVGGKASNNTRHLAEIVRKLGKPVQLVETACEVDFRKLQMCQEVGVLAGASTPQWVVDEVVEALEQEGRPPGFQRSFARFGHILHLPYALALAGFTLWLNHRMGWEHLALSTTLVLSIVLGDFALAPYLEAYGLDSLGRARGNMLRRRRKLFLTLGGMLLALGLVITGSEGRDALLFVLVLHLLEVTYLAYPISKCPSWNPRRVPGGRDFGLALTPALLTVGLPWLRGSPINRAGICAFFACFLGALGYHITRHIRDFQNDRILGPDLLPIAIGLGPARWVARLGALLSALLLTGLYFTHPSTGRW